MPNLKPAGKDSLTEEQIIRLIQSFSATKSEGLSVGIGDDAAVLNPTTGQTCVTTDLLVEGVHFDLSYISPYDLGIRAMAANLSDLASMGAKPQWGFLSLGLPKNPERDFVEGIIRGLNDLGEKHGLVLAGGDTVKSPYVVINLCLMGIVENKKPICRNTAHYGDAICVTGDLGKAMAGLTWLQAKNSNQDAQFQEAITAHLRPTPKVEAGRALAQSGKVSAMMDISDGLATDLARLCKASNLGAEIIAEKIPIAKVTKLLAQKFEADPIDWALTGGEDFELLFTCAKQDFPLLKDLVSESAKGLEIHLVGKITDGFGVKLVQPNGEKKEIGMTGFDHFREEVTP